MLMNDRPYAEKRDLHIGGVAPRNTQYGGPHEAPPALEVNSSHNEWGVESWDNDAEENEAMQNDSREDQNDDHPAGSRQWIGDTWLGDAWLGEDWDADAGESLLANARRALSVADDYVRDRPWQSLAVVALVGIALGYGLAAAGSRR